MQKHSGLAFIEVTWFKYYLIVLSYQYQDLVFKFRHKYDSRLYKKAFKIFTIDKRCLMKIRGPGDPETSLEEHATQHKLVRHLTMITVMFLPYNVVYCNGQPMFCY